MLYIKNLRDYTLQTPVAAADLGEDDGGHGVDAEQPREVEGHDLAQHQLLVRLPVPGITSSVTVISNKCKCRVFTIFREHCYRQNSRYIVVHLY